MKIKILNLITVFFLISCFSCKTKRYNTSPPISVKLPWKFKTEKAEYLNNEAAEFRHAHKYPQAIELYREAIKAEPTNPGLFFDISECYSNIDKLEEAILLLDTAIILDKSFAGFYNNRGLINWKLNKNEQAINDYKKAIELDSTNWIFHANISMVYYSANKMNEACWEFQMAKYLGLDMSKHTEKDNIEILSRICH